MLIRIEKSMGWSMAFSRFSRLFKRFPSLPCPICNRPVPLETAKTDSDGKAVHEDCYFIKIKLKRIKDGYA
jgi:hypothetical protein